MANATPGLLANRRHARAAAKERDAKAALIVHGQPASQKTGTSVAAEPIQYTGRLRCEIGKPDRD
jgi:hypothetical protein